MRTWFVRRGKHYRKRQPRFHIRHRLCKALDQFTAHLAGRHSRFFRRLRAKLNRTQG